MAKTRLLVACCSYLSRVGLIQVLSKDKDFVIANETCEKDIVHDIRKTKPDILLLCCNYLMERGHDLINKVKENLEGIRIVAFNCNLSVEQELKLFKLGVAGILDENCSSQMLIKALNTVHEGELWLKREVIKSLVVSDSEKSKNPEDDRQELTERELEILALIAGGYKNKDISSELFVTEGTVKVHINNIYKKLDINDRMQATFYALKHNILSHAK